MTFNPQLYLGNISNILGQYGNMYKQAGMQQAQGLQGLTNQYGNLYNQEQNRELQRQELDQMVDRDKAKFEHDVNMAGINYDNQAKLFKEQQLLKEAEQRSIVQAQEAALNRGRSSFFSEPITRDETIPVEKLSNAQKFGQLDTSTSPKYANMDALLTGIGKEMPSDVRLVQNAIDSITPEIKKELGWSSMSQEQRDTAIATVVNEAIKSNDPQLNIKDIVTDILGQRKPISDKDKLLSNIKSQVGTNVAPTRAALDNYNRFLEGSSRAYDSKLLSGVDLQPVKESITTPGQLLSYPEYQSSVMEKYEPLLKQYENNPSAKGQILNQIQMELNMYESFQDSILETKKVKDEQKYQMELEVLKSKLRAAENSSKALNKELTHKELLEIERLRLDIQKIQKELND